MSKAGKVFVVVLLDHVDHEGGEDEDEEADVEGGDELLPVGVDHGTEEFPRPAPSVHADHAENLEEPETTESGSCINSTSKTREDDKRGTEMEVDINYKSLLMLVEIRPR